MSGNERIPDALADFESIIRGGGSVEEAIRESAIENDLKPAVVKFRAEKEFGNLELYRQHCLKVTELRIEKRAKMQPLVDFIDAIYGKADRPQLPFIPIGRFIRTNFSEGHDREGTFSFSHEHQKKWRTK